MYEYLKGITKITAKYIVLETNGIRLYHTCMPILCLLGTDRSKKLKFMCIRLCVRTPIYFMDFAQKMRKTLSQSDFSIWDWACVSSCYYRC